MPSRLSRSTRARLATLAVVAASFVSVTPAHAGTASFGGTVYDGVTGEPAAGVCVLVWKDEGDTAYEQYPDHCTDADGHWSRTGLEPGTYMVQASGGEYVTQYAYGHGDIWSADRFTVTDGDSVTVDLTMERAGAIAGTVTDAITGDPIDGACVNADSPQGYGFACTGPDGTYHLSGLRPGADYVVDFSDWSGGHTSEYAHDTTDWAAATRFTVVAGEVLQVDEELDRAAGITGTVTDAATGAGLGGICLMAMTDPQGDTASGYACADESGQYAMTGVSPGTYYVIADDESGAHPRTWYPGTTDPAAATTVTVESGVQAGGVDLAMGAAAYVTGTVTRASTGEPLAGVCTYGVRPSDGVVLRYWGPASCTDENGRYTLGGLPAGDVKVQFNPVDPQYLEQWAHGADSAATAALIPVVAGETTAGVDAALLEAGRITGRVVDATTKQPVEGVCATVGVYSHRSGENGTPWPGACTGPDGRYEISGLATGSYTVEFYDPDGTWAWQFFPGKADRVQAAQVAVTAGSVVSGINAKLLPGGTVRGVVLDGATGRPVEGICLDGFTARRHDPFGTSYCTLADGSFVLKGFPTTSVKVQLFDSNGAYADEWAVDKTSFETATAVPTVAGGTTPLPLTVTRLS